MKRFSAFARPVVVLAASAGVIAGSAAFAGTAEDRAAILQSCDAVLQMSGSQCNCIADLAEADLSDKEYVVFVAAVSDVEQMNVIINGAGLTGEEAMTVMTFLSTSPSQCQNG